jgi:hypothetical protein
MSSFSADDHHEVLINSATGLEMIGDDICGFDVGGSTFGHDIYEGQWPASHTADDSWATPASDDSWLLTAKRDSMLTALLLCQAACYFYIPSRLPKKIYLKRTHKSPNSHDNRLIAFGGYLQ